MNAIIHPYPPPAEAGIAPREAVVTFAGVEKVFRPRHDAPAVAALRGIDLDVMRGSILGVIGRSGAGKSTLIRLVNGLERPSAGRVTVDGTDITTLSERQLRTVRRRTGMIFQHFNLLSSRTVFDNIALPLEIAGTARAEIARRVDPLIDLVGLGDKRNRYPAELSGSQKQRVGIARALATQPTILLSDEATSALDPETTRSILDLLVTVNRELGLTILLITHELAVVRNVATDVAVMDQGRIVEQGSALALFSRPSHPTTRSFLAGEGGWSLPEFLDGKLIAEPRPGAQAVMRIVFYGPHATDPVLSQLAREQLLDVNIISGAVESIGGKPFGTLLVSLPGDARTLRETTAFLTGRGLDAEVIGYVP